MRIQKDYIAATCFFLESRLTQGNQWLAYDTRDHFTKEKNMYCFASKEAAEIFIIKKKVDEAFYQVVPIEPILNIMDSWFSITCMDELHAPDIHINTPQVLTNYEREQLQKNNYLTTKTNVMNEQNFEYLKDNIKYMGFGEKLNEQLEHNLNQAKDDFKLDFKAVVNNKPFEASLHFRKSDSSEMYFFNSYDASLQKGNGEKADQTFYLNKGKGITAKEAYNLLDGRAVHKELTNKDNVPYKAWVQLDFQNKDKHNNFEVKQFHENYAFDLKGEVGKYAIVELKDAEKEKALMQSLQKGNIQSVTIEKDGSTQKMFMQANPQFKSVTLYDGQMKRVQKEALEQYKSVSQSQGNEVKKEQKQEVKQDVNKDNKQKASKEIDKPKQIKSHSKKRSVSM
jgi:hypothetical protein